MAKEDDDKGAANDKTTSGKDASSAATGSANGSDKGSASSGGLSPSGPSTSSQSTGSQSGGAQSASGVSSQRNGQSQDAIALLKADHRAVEKLFAEFEKADDGRKEEIVEQACDALIIHTILEEEIFYPACREAASDEDPLDEAQVEHDSAKLLIVELLNGDPDDDYRDAQFKVLAEQIKHHVAEEEKPSSGIFAKAQAAKIDLDDLGRRIQARKQQLEARRGDLRPSRPVSFQSVSGGGFAGRSGGSRAYRSTEGDFDMPRNQGRDRDEYGRFTSDDDDRSGRSGSYSRSGDRGHGGWYGDSEGHSQAARSRGESRSYRDDDDDDRRHGRGRDDGDRGYRSSSSSRDHGQGGWFGDSRGHSEAARRGWDDPDHAPSGWFGDSRGHAEASRRGWDNLDHGRSGWYGDSEGHSEAARRGWDERDGGRSSRSYRDDGDGYRARSSSSQDRDRDSRGRFTSDDDRGYRSRGRDDDDDRGYRSSSSSRDRGQGGWFGDSRGHSEASRRGWDDRR